MKLEISNWERYVVLHMITAVTELVLIYGFDLRRSHGWYGLPQHWLSWVIWIPLLVYGVWMLIQVVRPR